ncbi:uncharacterized protein LOC143080836 isoform X1 [Mytilus galloprovincialis]|uniref:uncharacterized protein LOC143080836 isoform X1 n=1 Tax=Mytilus galloprovincialis TaxID=29158 RepID=UPI003F7C3BAE
MFNMLPLRKLIVSLPRSQIRFYRASVAESESVCREQYHEFDKSMDRSKFTTIEGTQGQVDNLTIQDSKRALEEAIDYSVHGPSVQGIQGGHDDLVDVLYNEKPESDIVKSDANVEAFNCHSSLNLHGCMQSNVPQPFTTSCEHYDSPCNIPGSGVLQKQKYINDAMSGFHPSRQYHTTNSHFKTFDQSSAQQESYPDPQGIQGDDCTLELWMETCMRYNLPNCQDQFVNIKEGRKTLKEVFAEQELMLKEIAENYTSNTKASLSAELQIDTDGPCPQGIQGDDCARYQLWLENCQRFSFGECKDQLTGIKSGRKNLAQILAEQDAQIKQAVAHYYQKRSYSTSSSSNQNGSEVGRDVQSQTNPGKLSNKDRLKRAVKEYGSTVIVFHVGISVISLGGFYLAVSSGIDMVSLLTKIGVGESLLQSKLTTGASTFVVAYAVHKVFAPVRIAITLTSVPLIVRYLRRIGFLKPPKISK